MLHDSRSLHGCRIADSGLRAAVSHMVGSRAREIFRALLRCLGLRWVTGPTRSCHLRSVSETREVMGPVALPLGLHRAQPPRRRHPEKLFIASTVMRNQIPHREMNAPAHQTPGSAGPHRRQDQSRDRDGSSSPDGSPCLSRSESAPEPPPSPSPIVVHICFPTND